MIKPDFWDNQENSSKVISELNDLKSVVKDFSTIKNSVDDLFDM